VDLPDTSDALHCECEHPLRRSTRLAVGEDVAELGVGELVHLGRRAHREVAPHIGKALRGEVKLGLEVRVH